MPFLKKYGFLLLLLLAGAGIYFYGLGRIPLDGDEAVTANIATGFGYVRVHPFDGFAKYEPVQGPVFSSAGYWQRNTAQRTMRFTIDDCGHSFTSNLIIHYWINLRGFSVAALREPSAFFVLISVLLFYIWISRKLKDPRAVKVATVLFMLHALVVQVAHFARMYGFALLLLMVLLILYDNLQTAITEGRNRKLVINSLLAGITAALLLITHYITIIVLAALLADLFFTCRKEKNNTALLRILLAAALPFCALMLVYLFPLNAIKSIKSVVEMNRIASDLSVPRKYFTPATPLTIVWGLLCRFTTLLGNSASSEIDMKGFVNILLMVFPLTVILLNIKSAAARYGRRIIYYFLTGIAAYTIISLLHILLTHTTVILHARYWIFALPCSLGLLAVCFAASRHDPRRAVRVISLICISVLAVRMAFTSVAYAGDLRYSLGRDAAGHIAIKQDKHWAGEWSMHAAERITADYRAGDTVSFRSWVVAQQTNWYLKQYPQIVQRVDTTQKPPVVLLAPEGKRILWP